MIYTYAEFKKDVRNHFRLAVIAFDTDGMHYIAYVENQATVIGTKYSRILSYSWSVRPDYTEGVS